MKTLDCNTNGYSDGYHIISLKPATLQATQPEHVNKGGPDYVAIVGGDT